VTARGSGRRRRTAAYAGAAAVTAFAATVGLGANLGLFGLAQPDAGTSRVDQVRSASVARADAAPSTGPALPADD
jgi:hypothetical protein